MLRDEKPLLDSFVIQIQYYADGLANSWACLASFDVLFHILDFPPRSAKQRLSIPMLSCTTYDPSDPNNTSLCVCMLVSIDARNQSLDSTLLHCVSACCLKETR